MAGYQQDGYKFDSFDNSIDGGLGCVGRSGYQGYMYCSTTNMFECGASIKELSKECSVLPLVIIPKTSCEIKPVANQNSLTITPKE